MKRSPKKDDRYGLPPAGSLKKPGVAGRAMNKIIREEELIEGFHRSMVHKSIVIRYALALALRADNDAYCAWARDERVKKLSRPLKNPDDTLRALCQATITDPKKASKYYKRVEHLWKEKKPAEDVAQLLEDYGLEKRIPHLPGQGSGPQEENDPIDNEKPAGDPEPSSGGGTRNKATADDLAKAAHGSSVRPVAIVYVESGDRSFKIGDSIRIIGTVAQTVDDGFWVNIDKYEPTLKLPKS